jgi:hypothetical protein
MYTLTCGINYYRIPFSVSANITTDKYSVDELEKLCRIIAKDLNEYSKHVDRDENGIFNVVLIKLDGKITKRVLNYRLQQEKTLSSH